MVTIIKFGIVMKLWNICEAYNLLGNKESTNLDSENVSFFIRNILDILIDFVFVRFLF